MTLSNKFFSLIVASAALVTTTTVISTNVKVASKASENKGPDSSLFYQFEKGWNSFAIPLTTSFTARDICTMVTESEKIATITANTWEYYDCKENTANFDILPNHGYMLKSASDTTWSLAGVIAGSPYQLTPGLNLAGVSQTIVDSVYANTLCDLHTTNNLKVDSISQFENGRWDYHFCTTPSDNNFQLFPGQAYMINVGLKNSEAPNIPTLK
ncbi:hypothetical protein IPM62_01450 [Candidatus Woesebacteria bacterium]|nr:MAG: hypothetical protein IPM62_01450 [Candidatus Woesebacteria bacterium]